VHVSEPRLLGFLQVQIGEKSPKTNRQITHEWLLDLTEPADELGEQTPGNAVH
jgi:hypothetical protein